MTTQEEGPLKSFGFIGIIKEGSRHVRGIVPASNTFTAMRTVDRMYTTTYSGWLMLRMWESDDPGLKVVNIDHRDPARPVTAGATTTPASTVPLAVAGYLSKPSEKKQETTTDAPRAERATVVNINSRYTIREG